MRDRRPHTPPIRTSTNQNTSKKDMTNNQTLESGLVVQWPYIVVDYLSHMVFVKRVKCCSADFVSNFRPQLPQEIEIRLSIAVIPVV